MIGVGLAVSACTFDPPAYTGPGDAAGRDGSLAEAGPNDAEAADLGPIDSGGLDAGDAAAFPDAQGEDATPDGGLPPAPGVQSLVLTLPANTSTTVRLIGRPVGGGALQFSLDTASTLGQAVLSGDRVTYQAPADYAGADHFAYQATEGTATSSRAQVRIQIYDNRSCRRILETAPPPVRTGPYRLDVDGTGSEPPFEGWCEMTAANGGWLLVGRSAPGGNVANFGWRDAAGSLSDDAAPYALDALGHEVEFDRILAASHLGDKAPVDAYLLDYGDDFWGRCRDRACFLDQWQAISGGCPTSLTLAPTMLYWAGRHELEDHFFFRDNSGDFETGLRPDGWNLFYNACAFGAGLHAQQGLLFVRCDGSRCRPPSW